MRRLSCLSSTTQRLRLRLGVRAWFGVLAPGCDVDDGAHRADRPGTWRLGVVGEGEVALLTQPRELLLRELDAVRECCRREVLLTIADWHDTTLARSRFRLPSVKSGAEHGRAGPAPPTSRATQGDVSASPIQAWMSWVARMRRTRSAACSVGSGPRLAGQQTEEESGRERDTGARMKQALEGQSRAADSKLLTSALCYVSHPRPPTRYRSIPLPATPPADTNTRKYRPPGCRSARTERTAADLRPHRCATWPIPPRNPPRALDVAQQ